MQFFEYGKVDGVPLVFLLGPPHTGDSVAELSELASHWGIRLICPTRPWYAGTAVEPSFAASTGPIIDYLHQHGIRRACAIGGSGGGPFALHLTTNHTDTFDACYLLASMGTPEIFMDKVASPQSRLLIELFRAKSYAQTVAQLGEWGMTEQLAHGVWSDFKVLFGSWESIRLDADIAVRIHHGRSDDNAPLESVQALALQLADSEFRISPTASHLGLANDEDFTEFRTIFADVAGRQFAPDVR